MNRYFSLVPVIILLTTVYDQKAPSIEATPRMVRAAQVTAVGNAQQRTFPARIESGNSTELLFKRGGQVESLDIRQGVTLTQGQTLMRLNTHEAQQRINERQTTTTLAQRQSDRFQTLAERQAIPQAEMDMQCINRNTANAALKITREELAQMNPTAPFGEIATGVHIRNHQVVVAGQPAVTLMCTNLLDVVFSIPENLFTSLDIHNTVYRPIVRINTLPGRGFTVEYKEHTGSSDNSTLTWQIILTMPRPGDFPTVDGVGDTMTVNLDSLLASVGQETLVVPVEAVFNPDNRPKNGPVIWVVKGENAHLYLGKRRITVGEVISQEVMITGGLRAGEQVVAAGVSELHGRQPVRI